MSSIIANSQNKALELLLVYNPASGRGDFESELPRLISYYSREGALVTLYPTRERGDGYRFLKQVLTKRAFDRVVAAGGDGTLNEIASALLDSGLDIPLGYIPVGSTNDFGRTAEIPSDILQAAEVTLKGSIQSVDIGRLNGRAFNYVAAFGLFTSVTYTTPQHLKNLFGYAAYIMEGAKQLFPTKSYSLTIKSDHSTVSGEFIAGIISNSFYVGGRPTLNRDLASLTDGIFELVLIRKPKDLFDYNDVMLSFLKGESRGDALVYLQSSHFTVEGEEIAWNLDGESGGSFDRAEIKIEQRRLKLIISD